MLFLRDHENPMTCRPYDPQTRHLGDDLPNDDAVSIHGAFQVIDGEPLLFYCRSGRLLLEARGKIFEVTPDCSAEFRRDSNTERTLIVRGSDGSEFTFAYQTPVTDADKYAMFATSVIETDRDFGLYVAETIEDSHHLEGLRARWCSSRR